MIHAVIGIGSNSTKFLLADIDEGRVIPLLRLREGTRLFAGLSDSVLSAESMRRTAEAVGRLAQRARQENAQALHIFATSASRDALNGDAFCDLVEAHTGVRPEILSGEEEGRLSFLGCAGEGYCGLLDLGGGSTEIATGGEGRLVIAVSAQLGAVRLFQEIPSLSGEGLAKAIDLSMKRIAKAKDVWDNRKIPTAWYGVGGTLTCLASMDMALPGFDREAVEGCVLTLDAVKCWAEKLAGMPLAQRLAISGILPERGDIIAHGAAALYGAMLELGISQVIVSNRTNLDGYLQRIANEKADMDTVARIRSFYDESVESEWSRLEKGFFEFEINKRFMDRYIKPGDKVLDVGGGPGRYSLHLAARGVDVTLVDLSEGNVLFAKEKAIQEGVPLHAVQGDARRLDDVVTESYDAILLMGPLYHLLNETDRVQAVEACLGRLKPGGVLFAAFISMTAAMIFAARELPESILWEGEQPFYRKLLAGEDYAGPAFTYAYFIAPDYLLPFMERFPLTKLHLVGSEGITAPFHQSLAKASPEAIGKWLELSMALCEQPGFHNYTEHFLYIGRKRRD